LQIIFSFRLRTSENHGRVLKYVSHKLYRDFSLANGFVQVTWFLNAGRREHWSLFWKTNPNNANLDARDEKSPSLQGEIKVVLLYYILSKTL